MLKPINPSVCPKGRRWVLPDWAMSPSEGQIIVL